jgi:hypothetical protein
MDWRKNTDVSVSKKQIKLKAMADSCTIINNN